MLVIIMVVIERMSGFNESQRVGDVVLCAEITKELVRVLANLSRTPGRHNMSDLPPAHPILLES
jgi:hypothetical protein